MTIDDSNCYKKCSGLIVTSFTPQEMDNKFRSKLLKYLFSKDVVLDNYSNDLRGLSWLLMNFPINLITKKMYNVEYKEDSEFQKTLSELSSEYWTYKGYYDYPSKYKG